MLIFSLKKKIATVRLLLHLIGLSIGTYMVIIFNKNMPIKVKKVFFQKVNCSFMGGWEEILLEMDALKLITINGRPTIIKEKR